MSGARGSKKSIWDTRFSKLKPKKALAFDECLKLAGWAIDDWITVHPNGPDEVGRHVELDGEGRILHGMGKENEGKKMSEVGIKSAFPKDYHNEPNRPDDINHPGFKKRVWGYNAEIKENERKAAEAAKQAQEKQEAPEKKSLEQKQAELDRRQKEINDDRNKRPGSFELRVAGKTDEAHAEETRRYQENLELGFKKSQLALEKDYVANPPKKLDEPLSKEEAIDKLAFDDRKGYCASLSLAYIANAYAGLDVSVGRDDTRGKIAGMQDGLVQELGGTTNEKAGFDGRLFRGLFENGDALKNETVYPRQVAADTIKNANLQVGHEYLFAACSGNGSRGGGHSAIVRVVETSEGKRQYQYLELQSTKSKGWRPFDGNTWTRRFGLSKSTKGCASASIIDVEDVAKSQEFKDMLPYINKGK